MVEKFRERLKLRIASRLKAVESVRLSTAGRQHRRVSRSLPDSRLALDRDTAGKSATAANSCRDWMETVHVPFKGTSRSLNVSIFPPAHFAFTVAYQAMMGRDQPHRKNARPSTGVYITKAEWPTSSMKHAIGKPPRQISRVAPC